MCILKTRYGFYHRELSFNLLYRDLEWKDAVTSTENLRSQKLRRKLYMTECRRHHLGQGLADEHATAVGTPNYS